MKLTLRLLRAIYKAGKSDYSGCLHYYNLSKTELNAILRLTSTEQAKAFLVNH